MQTSSTKWKEYLLGAKASFKQALGLLADMKTETADVKDKNKRLREQLECIKQQIRELEAQTAAAPVPSNK